MADEFPYHYHPDFDEEINKKINMEIMKYAGMYILKKMDLPPEENGHIFEVPLPGSDVHLEPILDDLFFNDLVEIDTVNVRYAITKEGQRYIDKLLDEIEGYIEKYQDFEPLTRVNLMKRDKVNPLRARFLWGLYDGEFDDVEQFQDDWEVNENQRVDDWREFITKKEFYDLLFKDINHMKNMDNNDLDQVLSEMEKERIKDAPDIKIIRMKGNNGNGNGHNNDRDTRNYYYQDPYYFNPVYDPLFWYIVY